MKRKTPRTDKLEETVKILEERIDDLEHSEFFGMLNKFDGQKRSNQELDKLVDNLEKINDNVSKEVSQDEVDTVTRLLVNGVPVVEFHQTGPDKVPYTFIPRNVGHICGNCAWASGNACTKGMTPLRRAPFNTNSCWGFERRKFYN